MYLISLVFAVSRKPIEPRMKSDNRHERYAASMSRLRKLSAEQGLLELTAVLIALIVLTIVLAGVFLVRSSITAGPRARFSPL